MRSLNAVDAIVGDGRMARCARIEYNIVTGEVVTGWCQFARTGHEEMSDPQAFRCQ